MGKSVVQQSFGTNLKVLHVAGLFPTKNYTFFYKMYAYFLILMCLILDPVLCIIKLIQDPSVVDNNDLFVIGAMIAYVPKFLPFILNHKKIMQCLKFLDTMATPVREYQRKIFEDCIRISKRNSMFFFWYQFTNSISWPSRPLIFSEKLVLPMNIWLPYDPFDNFIVFCCTYTSLAISVVYCAFMTSAADCLVSGLIYHVSGQIKILKDNLQHLSEYAEETMNETFPNYGTNNEIKNKLIYKNIKECIQHHSLIFTFTKQVEEAFSFVVFSQFIGSIVIICFTCFQLSKMDPKSLNFVVVATYFLFELLQLYFFCYYGTILYEENETVPNAVYSGPWYEYNLKCKKALVILMNCSNRSLKITVGKLLGCSLDTFTMIIRRSYSLLAVLRNYEN